VSALLFCAFSISISFSFEIMSSYSYPYPVWLPGTIALGASFVSGLTTFGDGIIFLSVWAILNACGVVSDSANTFQSAIIFITLLPLASLPIVCWIARREIWDHLGWGALISSSTASFVPVGIHILSVTDLKDIKVREPNVLIEHVL
jgi:hypothetical protein